MAETLNINVGILGHVDSGKTSLVRALSTELSTASLDKNPQSQERGITLDLGFSAFFAETPPQLVGSPYRRLQYTLVDCPGHASLIRTVIGGAQIIDMMILVVDIVKGIQTQTAECLVIAEITTDNMIVVLNKVDLLPIEGRDKQVEKVIAKIKKVLASTKFANAPFVVLSAAPGGQGKIGAAAPLESSSATGVAGPGSKQQSDTVKDLVEVMKKSVKLPNRSATGPFLFAIDHCFPIKGQGTVMTGTCLAGSIKVNDAIELPALKLERKVKSMQMFKQPVPMIKQGDRAGICVANLDAALVERGLACTLGAVPSTSAAVALVRKIRFYKGPCESEARFHVIVGHTTVMATAVFFGAKELAASGITSAVDAHAAADADAAAAAVVESFAAASLGATADAAGHDGGGGSSIAASAAPSAATLALSNQHGAPQLRYDYSSEWEWQNELLGGRQPGGGGAAPATAAASSSAAAGAPKPGGSADGAQASKPASAPGSSATGDIVYEWQWAALLFDSPILAPVGSMVIGTKLDTSVNANTCRIAFYGRLSEPLPSNDLHELRKLNIYKLKEKVGQIDRIDKAENSGSSGGAGIAVIGKNLFKKETDMSQFTGLTVHTKAGQAGVIDSSFGKSGKFRATFPHPERIDPYHAALGAGKNAVEARAIAAAAMAGAAAPPSSSSRARDTTIPIPTGQPVPTIKAGEPIILRFRKYMYEKKDKAESGSKHRVLIQ